MSAERDRTKSERVARGATRPQSLLIHTAIFCERTLGINTRQTQREKEDCKQSKQKQLSTTTTLETDPYGEVELKNLLPEGFDDIKIILAWGYLNRFADRWI